MKIEGTPEEIATFLQKLQEKEKQGNHETLFSYHIEQQQEMLLPQKQKQLRRKTVSIERDTCESCKKPLEEDRCRYCRDCANSSSGNKDVLSRYQREIYSRNVLARMKKASE